MSATPCPTGCGHAHGLGGCSSWECHPPDARPTPPPVPPDTRLLSVEEGGAVNDPLNWVVLMVCVVVLASAIVMYRA